MRSITTKLVLLLMVTGLASIALVAFSIQQVIRTQFDDYVLAQHQDNFIEGVTAYYVLNGESWEGVEASLPGGRPPQNNNSNQPPPHQDPAPARFVLVDNDGQVVVGFDRYRRNQKVRAEDIEAGTPIEYDGEIIGTVLATNRSLQRDSEEEAYLATTNRALLIAAVGTVVVVLFVGIISARFFTKPIRALTNAVQAMQSGDLKQEVKISSRDELGILAESFNQMSEQVARAQQLRKQMTADIAHDLRSPLQVITGYLESMQDGVLKATPERLDTIYREALLLQRLVEDLRLLSMADAGELDLNLQQVDLRDVVERFAERYQHQAQQKNIALAVEIDHQPTPVRIDVDRIWQVLTNLVGNALRYSPIGEKVELKVRRDASRGVIIVEDHGQGIEAEKLPYIFERFYRADESRAAEDGQSGLGLAISRSIVEAHRGNIHVESVLGKGTIFTIVVPVE
ncbi:MAG: ATP-binding protein [Chloroflexi bacterium]|nr:ATP-binding protein [Chloroflexota bacterium]